MFVLVGGGEDFEVVEAAAGAAEEGALAVAEFFFGWFGAVLVDGIGPAVGDAGEEVVVVFGRGVDQDGLDLLQHGGLGDGAGFVQGGGDDGSGAGGDGPGGQGRGGGFAGRGHGVAGDPGAREDGAGEGEAASGLADADPEPDPQELGGVPAPIIGRIESRGRHLHCGGCGQGIRGGCINPSGSFRGGTRPSVSGGAGSAAVIGTRFGAGYGRRRFGAPAGGPARGLARRAGGVDRGDAGPVDRGGVEQLQLLDPARNLLGHVGEVRSLPEPSQRQLPGRGLHRRFQHRQALPQNNGAAAVGRRAMPTRSRNGNAAEPAAPQQGSRTETRRYRPACGAIRCIFPNGFHRKTLSEGCDIKWETVMGAAKGCPAQSGHLRRMGTAGS
ncbi:hypothetical protein J2809_003640 [Arthrobacter pascens]|nr:hypothetical protein [Arthrobacter pascens]